MDEIGGSLKRPHEDNNGYWFLVQENTLSLVTNTLLPDASEAEPSARNLSTLYQRRAGHEKIKRHKYKIQSLFIVWFHIYWRRKDTYSPVCRL